MLNPKTKWVRTISAVRPDKPGVVAYENRTPFDVMCAKGQLDSDPRINSLLHSAGARYRSDWRQSGLTYQVARAALGDRYARIVDPIVLEGRTSAEVQAATEYTAKQYARMAVRERLTAGLMCLARHYKIASL